MAVTPNSNEAFLREVDDELRRDELAGFWEKWGRWVIGGIVGALAIFGGVLYWQQHTEDAAGVEGERLQAAFESIGTNNFGAAATPLAQIAGSQRAGYRALAMFTQGDVLLQKQDLKGAAAKFGQIAGDASLGKPFRDLALLRQTTAEYDALKPQVVIERLRPLAVPGNAWFGSAGELVAIAYARSGRRDLAGALFSQIARNDDVPDTIRQRAVQMAGVLGVDAVAQNEENRAQ